VVSLESNVAVAQDSDERSDGVEETAMKVVIPVAPEDLLAQRKRDGAASWRFVWMPKNRRSSRFRRFE
jgi:hypothetical protein